MRAVAIADRFGFTSSQKRPRNLCHASCALDLCSRGKPWTSNSLHPNPRSDEHPTEVGHRGRAAGRISRAAEAEISILRGFGIYASVKTRPGVPWDTPTAADRSRRDRMRFLGTRLMSVASLGIGMLLFLSPVSGGAQAPGAAQTGKPEQQVQERNKLAKQVEELRQAGKFDEAVPVAERVLELERGAGAKTSAEVAEALSWLAELHELQGDWGRALARRARGPGRPRARGWERSLADGRRPAGGGVRGESCGPGGSGPGQGASRPAERSRRRPGWTHRASSLRRSAWRWKRWRPTGHWSVRSRRRWRGRGIESAGAGRHGTTQAEPRRPTSGR